MNAGRLSAVPTYLLFTLLLTGGQTIHYPQRAWFVLSYLLGHYLIGKFANGRKYIV